ncbi:MAG: tyrosine-type recombinase/integrase [Pseudomonadota bacterium]|nr:tyrosine-type recombinase/integrase [Pseudomonadota bacterium]
MPARWRLYHGAYYYRVPPGLEALWGGRKQYRLGSTLGEAASEWAKRMANAERRIVYIRDLLDRYAIEAIPMKAAATQRGDNLALVNLRKVFGDMLLDDLEPRHIYKYVDARVNKQGQKSPATGVHEIRVFKHAFTKAVEWGLISKHPFKGEVRLKGTKPRSRYVEDWEIIEALSLVPKRKSGSVLMLQAYVRVKMLIGIRRGDMLRLRMSDITEAGITVRPHKTANSTGLVRTFEWTPALRAAVEMALVARPIDIAPWLFCTKRGEGYFNEETGQATGWDSMWQRFMSRLLAETKISQRFTEHDLRGKVGSDAESVERARQLLGHADSKITERVYRRKPELIRPLR